MKKLIAIALISAGTLVGLRAQSDLTLYNFNSIAQSLHTNPAYPQQTRVWVGIPVISGVQTYYHNNGFRPIDLFESGTDVNQNIDDVILGLNDKNQIAANESIDLLGVGFKTKNGFFSIGARQIVDYKMTYPVDLLRLIRFGNADDEYRNTNISSFDFETISRTNYYIGYQHQLNDKLNIGGRFKYIIGQANSYVEKMNASIETQENSDILVKTDIEIRTAGFVNLVENPFEVKNHLFPQNSGFAVDLGAHYQMNNKWSFSASILDLGFVNWKTNTRYYNSKGEYEYEGYNADLTEDKPIDSFDDVLDSLKAAFDFDEVDGEKYSRWLSSQVFLSANYRLNDRHSFGGLYHMRVWNGKVYHDFSANYQGRISRAFQYTVSYSIINNTYNNLGAGLQLKLGPVQLYMLSDNILHIFMYENLNTSNVRVGLNVTLFDKKTKKKKATSNPDEPVNIDQPDPLPEQGGK